MEAMEAMEGTGGNWALEVIMDLAFLATGFLVTVLAHSVFLHPGSWENTRSTAMKTTTTTTMMNMMTMIMTMIMTMMATITMATIIMAAVTTIIVVTVTVVIIT